MLEAHKIRLENLKKLMAELNVDPHEVADSWGTSEAYLRQCLGGRHAKIGINMATRIEKAQGLPVGWLTQKHTTPFATSPEEITEKILLLAQPLDSSDIMSLCQQLLAIATSKEQD